MGSDNNHNETGGLTSYPSINDLVHRKVPLAMAVLSVLACGLALSTTSAHGAPVSQDDALTRAREWMTGHPIMSDAAERPIQTVETLTSSEGFSVYVAGFCPQGYVVLNSDDCLPLVVSFSADTVPDLSDDPQNAFREMLQLHVDGLAAGLAKAAEEPTARVSRATILAVTEQYGPFLDSEWNQTKPYNLFCPTDPMGNSYYGYRTPTGCVPTAFAQIMRFHQWPPRGNGSFSYTDASGFITGNHSADFSDPYDWASMQDQYSEYNSNPPAAERAVSELVYEIGVAAEINYESDSSSAGIFPLGNRLGKFFHYEPIRIYNDLASLIPPMEADLRAGYPCLASISSHLIVVDGLLSDNGTKSYHINYGWGGTNNGWYNANSFNGKALNNGITYVRPGLVAVTVTNSVMAVEGQPFVLKWIAPTQRTNEIARVEIKRQVQHLETWQTMAEELTEWNVGWEIDDSGRSGRCWFAGPNTYASQELGEVFVPNTSTDLVFWQLARGISFFSVEVSTDDGLSYTPVYTSPQNVYDNTWVKKTVALSAYSGQSIRLRFVVPKEGNDDAGIRVDDISLTSSGWYTWEPFAEDTQLAVCPVHELENTAPASQTVFFSPITAPVAGTHILGTSIVDTGGRSSILSTFTLTVAPANPMDDSDGDGMPRGWEVLYGLDVGIDDGALDPDQDGYSNYAEYICGTNPDNTDSFWRIELNSDGLAVFSAADDRLYTILYSTNLLDAAWVPLATGIIGTNGPLLINDYDPMMNQTSRFYRVQVTLPE